MSLFKRNEVPVDNANKSVNNFMHHLSMNQFLQELEKHAVKIKEF